MYSRPESNQFGPDPVGDSHSLWREAYPVCPDRVKVTRESLQYFYHTRLFVGAVFSGKGLPLYPLFHPESKNGRFRSPAASSEPLSRGYGALSAFQGIRIPAQPGDVLVAPAPDLAGSSGAYAKAVPFLPVIYIVPAFMAALREIRNLVLPESL